MSHSEVCNTAVVRPVAATDSVRTEPGSRVCDYELQEKIGVGGYGEVWRAVGPGGFLKAVKILYGVATGPQAETELKSLKLMRDLRHPFLLNVERIELVDDRLIVVTELADHSLEQRFQEVVRGGGRGIPRDELLGYLRDAADALDFMSEHHGLQHLDIKPENLLIQGRHTKVGDFGLTKSVGTTRLSLVSGFTPLYAPPELFDGRASRNSDQYSLAIVFQTMLTGVPPFNGRTAAQLTSQHLRSAPDLSPLAPGDRAVVARAMSKNPQTRFDGCRQFIDELSRRRQAGNTPHHQRSVAVDRGGSGLTQMVIPGKSGQTDESPIRPAIPLSPLTGPQTAAFRPTLFIAVGGLGARIVRELSRGLTEQFGDGNLPAAAFLCVDTEKSALTELRSSVPDALVRIETIAIPLRTAVDYRKQSAQHLSWLSRRWLFNIPKSGNVEGMRPLGRLAFIDHQARLRDTVTSLVAGISAETAVAETAARTGLPFRTGGIDICLIGATSGGCGSGCLMDMGFMAKRILHRNGLPNSTVTAMLLHATSVGRQHSDAQDANSVSFLKELSYFSLPGTGLSSDERTLPTGSSPGPFDSTFFIHLGDDLTNADFDDQIASVCRYLRSWSFAPERAELESWRTAERAEQGHQSELTLRTFGLAALDGSVCQLAGSESESLALALVHLWLEQDSAAGSGHNDGAARKALAHDVEFAQEVQSLLESVALTGQQIQEFIPLLLRGETGKRIEACSADVWRQLTSQLPDEVDLEDLVSHLAAIVSQDGTSDTSSAHSVSRVARTVQQELARRLQQTSLRIRQQLCQTADRPFHLARARFLLQACLERVDEAVEACSLQKSEVQEAFAALCTAFLSGKGQQSGSHSLAARKSFCQQYCLLLICQAVCQCVISHLMSLRETLINQHLAAISACQRQLRQIASGMIRDGVALASLPSDTVEAFERFQLVSGQFRISTLLRTPDDPPRSGAALASDAVSFFAAKTRGAETAECPADAGTAGFPSTASPVLANVGGGRRVLALIPSASLAATWKPRLQAEFGDCVVVREAPGQGITACCEVEGIFVPAVIESLTHLRPGVAELAERVHSRIDIAW